MVLIELGIYYVQCIYLYTNAGSYTPAATLDLVVIPHFC